MTEEQLAVMQIMVGYKSCARAKELEEYKLGDYSPSNPHIASLMTMGLITLRGKAMMPAREAMVKALGQHKVPHTYRLIGNWIHSMRQDGSPPVRY